MVREIVERFHIWLIRLDPASGAEIRKTRPCVVISPNEMSSLKTVIVAPMTSKGFEFPTRIQCDFQNRKGLVLLDQIRTVDKNRLIQKLGIVSEKTQIEIVHCLQKMFAF